MSELDIDKLVDEIWYEVYNKELPNLATELMKEAEEINANGNPSLDSELTLANQMLATITEFAIVESSKLSAKVTAAALKKVLADLKLLS